MGHPAHYPRYGVAHQTAIWRRWLQTQPGWNIRYAHRFLALQDPRITVLTDQPLATREAYRESFALDFRMGPVLDIVRHPATRTPLAVAIYGSVAAVALLNRGAQAWKDGPSLA